MGQTTNSNRYRLLKMLLCLHWGRIKNHFYLTYVSVFKLFWLLAIRLSVTTKCTRVYRKQASFQRRLKFRSFWGFKVLNSLKISCTEYDKSHVCSIILNFYSSMFISWVHFHKDISNDKDKLNARAKKIGRDLPMLWSIDPFLNHLLHRKREMPVQINEMLSLTVHLVETPSKMTSLIVQIYLK